MTPIASVITPTYQHGKRLADAIDSALAQTVPVEVIVIDDGSTDGTAEVLERYAADERVRVFHQDHVGPSVARNRGIDAATAGFVMFLDADDTIEPTKVQEQLAEFDRQPEAGFVLCDVRIEDASRGGKVELASKRYRYQDKSLGGWIEPLLVDGNFIPIMSPLIRRSVLGDSIRFRDERVPEDWHFWMDVARHARVRYVPKVLATYRKSQVGRSRIPVMSRKLSPNIEQPLRLNLGCGTPATRSWHPIKGFVNLDKSLGWTFEDGLGDFVDHSVAGISISHALMYVLERDWHRVFSEFARVLVEGGVVRITEDECVDPRSKRVGGWKGSEPAVTLTWPGFVRKHLERVGLHAVDVDEVTTHYKDRSLMQAQHGHAPECFWIEGIKLPGTLFAPHNDDECLFSSFTILRYRPRVVICFGSAGDYGSTAEREAETREAMTILGARSVEQWNGGDLVERMRAYDEEVHPIRVWAPHTQTSHPDHLAVAEASREVFGSRVNAYHTYDAAGKVRAGTEVKYETEWIEAKLRALSRYKTQLTHPRAHQFFLNDLREYAE
jgi:glycosyltransferase involved in cell wall biosynthesis